jgi:hypothetical protein
MKSRMHAFCLFLIGASALYGQRNYRFDGKISREVLENCQHNIRGPTTILDRR